MRPIDRRGSLTLGVEQVRVHKRTVGCFADMYEAFKKHVRSAVEGGAALQPRPEGLALAAGVTGIAEWRVLGAAIVIAVPFGGAAAGVRGIRAAVPAFEVGSYAHFEETVFGTQNALYAFGTTEESRQGAATSSAGDVVGARPDGCWIDALVVKRFPAAPAVGQHYAATIIGVPTPMGAAGNVGSAGNPAVAAAQARGEYPLFAGLTTLGTPAESTLSAGVSLLEFGAEGHLAFTCEVVCVIAGNAAPAVPAALPNPMTPAGRASLYGCFWDLGDAFWGQWASGNGPPEVLEGDVQRAWALDDVAPFGSIASARARNHVQHGHFLGGTKPWALFEMAKVLAISGLADAKMHTKDPSATMPQTLIQAATQLSTVIHIASHPTPALFAACLKSGKACSKGGLCVPVLECVLLGGFTHYDASRSRETLTPKSQVWAGYSSEILRVAAQNRAEPLLAAELDIDRTPDRLKEVFRKNWAAHEKFTAWNGVKDTFYDELGTDVRDLGSTSKEDVLPFLVRGKAIITTFDPRSSLLATEGFKDIGEADALFVQEVHNHKRGLRSKMSKDETDVYSELLASGRPSLAAFA